MQDMAVIWWFLRNLDKLFLLRIVHWANENSPWKTLSMTSVYRLADETEEFSFIPSKNHKKLQRLKTSERGVSLKKRRAQEGTAFKSDNIIWETQQKSNKKMRQWN